MKRIRINQKNYWKIGLCISIIAFILLLSGVRFVLENPMNLQNLIAFVAFSLLVGVIGGGMVFARMNLAFVVFTIGLIVGYFEMFRGFLKGLSGWGDLIGILSLFTWSLIGLTAGLLAQLSVYLYKKMGRG